MTKIKVKKKAADWAVFSFFFKAAQIWSTRPMRYSPVQADQKKLAARGVCLQTAREGRNLKGRKRNVKQEA